MPKGAYGIGAFFVVLAIIIIVIKCCVRLMKSEDYGSKSSSPFIARQYVLRRGDSTNENLLQPGPSGIQSSRSVISASPVVVPPYPVEARHPTPQSVPQPGFATHNPPYPTHTPHPMPVAGAAPYPPAAAAPYPPVSNTTPYPPVGPPAGSTAPYPDYSANPPSYSEAVGQPPIQPPPAKEGYSKQSPYNPNY